MFPIEAPELKQRVLTEIVPAYLRDNVKSRILQPDGSHYRLQPSEGEPRYRCQEELLAIRPDLSMGEADIAGNGAAPAGEVVVVH